MRPDDVQEEGRILNDNREEEEVDEDEESE